MSALLTVLACREDMQDQPKFKPLRQSDFYTDGRSERPLVANTVPRGYLRADIYFYTGMINGQPGDLMPFPVTADVLKRGQERFNIFCSPCHSELGDGNGMIPQRGFRRPPSFHIDRLRAAPVGHFFDVMTNGFGAMPDYAAQIPPRDRWNIIAYIRALQLSQRATLADVPPGQPVPSPPPSMPGVAPTGATPPGGPAPQPKGGK